MAARLGRTLVAGLMAALAGGGLAGAGLAGCSRSTPDATTASTGGAPTAPAGPEVTDPGSIDQPLTLPSPAPDPTADTDQAPGDDPGDDPAAGAGIPDTVPASATELAAELTRAEQAVRDPSLDAEVVAAWGRRQQYLYRLLGAHPGWVDEVKTSVPADLVTVVEHNHHAGRELAALLDTEDIRPTLPAWRIDEPRPADELVGHYRDAAEATGVPWTILAAINLVETRMGRINGLSSAGAVGPMQFLPTTWAECCVGDPTEEADAIRGAAEYLIDRGAARDLDRAIWGYNNSDHYVAAVRAYASVLDADERAYAGYHAWEVHYLSTAGLAHLPVGYEQDEPVDAATWLTQNPDHLVVLDPSGS